MMDLILWRHAEALEAAPGESDLARALTPRGERDAARMAHWLERQLPDGLRVLSSPALRTRQTADALGRKVRLRDELSPGGTADELLECARWPQGRGAVLVVGHQPVLGEVVARLLGISAGVCAVRKGSVWWLRQRTSEQEDVQKSVCGVDDAGSGPGSVSGRFVGAWTGDRDRAAVLLAMQSPRLL